MRGGIAGAAVLVTVLAACGGSGISAAEHDQTLAELALVQQDLAEARRQLAESAMAGQGASSKADELEARINQIVRDNNIVLGAQQDPLDELGRLIADFHEREASLVAEFEVILSEGEPVATAPPAASVAPYVELAALTVAWLAQPELPDWQTVSITANAIEEAGDPDLFAMWDEMAAQYDEFDVPQQRRWLGDLGGLALVRAGEIASAN